jgi:uncharacterized radical SAM superfamily protein
MTTTVEQLDTWYVVHDGLDAGSENQDTNPIAGHGVFEKEIREEYTKTLASGFADKDKGLYLKKLTGVTEEQAEELSENLNDVVLADFAGYNVEVLEVYKSSFEDWMPEAFEDIELEDATVDADGWSRS